MDGWMDGWMNNGIDYNNNDGMSNLCSSQPQLHPILSMTQPLPCCAGCDAILRCAESPIAVPKPAP
jgi:hypothetical protein